MISIISLILCISFTLGSIYGLIKGIITIIDSKKRVYKLESIDKHLKNRLKDPFFKKKYLHAQVDMAKKFKDLLKRQNTYHAS